MHEEEALKHGKNIIVKEHKEIIKLNKDENTKLQKIQGIKDQNHELEHFSKHENKYKKERRLHASFEMIIEFTLFA